MIAVIGTGITGLSSAWILSKYFPVTLFEKHSILGMAAFGTRFQAGNTDLEFDIPFRTVKKDYYPLIFDIYRSAGIRTRKVDYSFRVESEKETVFGFRARNILGNTLGLPTFDSFRNRKGIRIFKDLLRFYTNARKDFRNEKEPVSILDFLKRHSYSYEFIYEFLLPTFALVNTCRTETVGNYPAETIIGYHSRGYGYTPQETAELGTSDIVKRLSSSVKNIRLGTEIRSIRLDGGRPVVETDAGSEKFDHVIVTTQANQAERVLDKSLSVEKSILSRFKYEASDVILHRDRSYFSKKDVSLLFRIQKGTDKPEVTLDLARIIPECRGSEIYQTWNPHTVPDESFILKTARFERPTVDLDTVKAVADLEKIQNEKDRRIWFGGSYSMFGIPLLEAGARAALSVSSKISGKSEEEIRKDWN